MRREVKAGVVLTAFAAVSNAIGATTPFRPVDPGFVVAELPGGASRSRDRFARQLLEARNDPGVAAQLASELLEQARTTMQPQLYGRAESIIAPWMARPSAPPGLLVIQADILQQRHEFQQAVRLLDRVIARDSRAARARLMRANTYIVTGQFDLARPDCAWLLGSGEQWTGTVCLGQVLGSTGRLAQASALLDRLLSNGATATSPDVLAWTCAVRADLAMRAGSLSEAQGFLRRAVSVAPSSEYLRLALADVLMAAEHFDEVLELLNTARPSAGVLLRRAEALGAAPGTLREQTLAELRERLAVSKQRGERTHLREETRLALDLSQDAAGALALAQENFAIQREAEDVRLLARAAAAAGDAAILKQLQEWLQHTRYQDVVVERLLHQERAS